jgi:hypothetical protein
MRGEPVGTVTWGGMAGPGERVIHGIAILAAAVAAVIGIAMVVDGYWFGAVIAVVAIAFIGLRVYLIVQAAREPVEDADPR